MSTYQIKGTLWALPTASVFIFICLLVLILTGIRFDDAGKAIVFGLPGKQARMGVPLTKVKDSLTVNNVYEVCFLVMYFDFFS